MNKIKNVIIILESIVLLYLLAVHIPSIQQIASVPIENIETIESQTNDDESEPTPLTLTSDLFEPSSISTGNGAYSVVFSKQSYQSYPTTEITLNPDYYSSKEKVLPPVKMDEEIYTNDPETDHLRESKQNSIKEYGDLARRYVGSAGDSWFVDSIKEADVDKDGSKEKIISIITIGANIIGKRNVVVKNDKEIFSTTETSFSDLIPAENGNGFFLEWEDNFKKRDGYMSTRFIYENMQFIPIYEQQVRYVRIGL